MREFISEMAKNDVVRCAVEWAEARHAQEWAMCEDEALPLTEQRGIEERVEDAEDALKDAVRRWKEAQA